MVLRGGVDRRGQRRVGPDEVRGLPPPPELSDRELPIRAGRGACRAHNGIADVARGSGGTAAAARAARSHGGPWKCILH